MKPTPYSTVQRAPRQRHIRRRVWRLDTLGCGLLALGLLVMALVLIHGYGEWLSQLIAERGARAEPEPWLAAYSAYDAPQSEFETAAVAAARAAAKANARGPAILPRDAVLKLPSAPSEVRQMINEVAAEARIAPALLHAVIATESRYNTDATSPRGAIGLMQLMPETALRFGAPDPYNQRDNVLAGANYLKFLMKLFGNDMELVLAGYNAGHNAVLRAGNRIPDYPETQAYVPKVLAYMRCASSALCRPT